MKRAPKHKQSVIPAIVIAVFMFAVLMLAPRFSPAQKPSAHFYGNPAVSIGKIDLNIFYAVPADRTAFDYDGIKAGIERIMPDALAFHKSQFMGKSEINYKIFPKPIVLHNGSSFYDTEDTNRGNPSALKKITLEIESRVFDKSGDLFSEDFAKSQDGFRVIAIIYEGVGASGTEGSSLLSRDYVTNKENERRLSQPADEYSLVSSALFYHEFGHTIGIPDGYDLETNDPYTNDIMGSGRREPIKSNYIDQKTLKAMGVL